MAEEEEESWAESDEEGMSEPHDSEDVSYVRNSCSLGTYLFICRMVSGHHMG